MYCQGCWVQQRPFLLTLLLWNSSPSADHPIEHCNSAGATFSLSLSNPRHSIGLFYTCKWLSTACFSCTTHTSRWKHVPTLCTWRQIVLQEKFRQQSGQIGIKTILESRLFLRRARDFSCPGIQPHCFPRYPHLTKPSVSLLSVHFALLSNSQSSCSFPRYMPTTAIAQPWFSCIVLVIEHSRKSAS